jgi:hypothetical protein
MKTKQLLTNEDINSVVKIERIDYFISFIGIDKKSGDSTELLRSHVIVILPSDGKHNEIYTMRLNNEDEDLKNLYVTEIEIYSEVTGTLNPEFAKIVLDSHLNIKKKGYVGIMCAIFEDKLKEVFCRNLGNSIDVRNTKINRYRGMFQDRNVHSKLKFQTSLCFSKKILKFL